MANKQTKGRVCNTIFSQRVEGTVKYVTNAKWKWAGHIA